MNRIHHFVKSLQDWVPAMLKGTSEVRSTSNTESMPSSVTTLAYLLIVLFIAAAIIGGGLACFGLRLFSSTSAARRRR